MSNSTLTQRCPLCPNGGIDLTSLQIEKHYKEHEPNDDNTYLHPFGGDLTFYPKKGKACKFCGLASIAHIHRAGTKPKDFERLEAVQDAVQDRVQDTQNDLKQKVLGIMCEYACLFNINKNDVAIPEKLDKELENMMSLINSELADAEKAYGGCHKCYGKGYSTVRYGLRSSSDFEGDKEYIDPIKTNIHFCDCDRGKQIEKLLADARKEVISKVEKLPIIDSSGLCDLIAKDDVLATLREEEKEI